MKKKILITGGSGFIGTNLIDFLLDDFHILSIDIIRPKKNSHLNVFLKVDVNDYEKLKSCIENFKPNYIIHLAARTDLKGKKINDYEVNYKSVENLIKICREKIYLKKIVFTSSMLVNKPGTFNNDLYFYNPTTIYGQSKVISEKLILNSKMDFKWLIIRPTSIWGPWFNEPYLNFFNLVLKGRYFHIGKKPVKKTYGYIKNSVIQISKLTIDENLTEDIFYIADENPYEIGEWANIIAKNANRKIITLPRFLFFLVAIFGDFLKLLNIKFPFYSYRYRNMTTNNVINVQKTINHTSKDKYKIHEATNKTIDWIKKNV